MSNEVQASSLSDFGIQKKTDRYGSERFVVQQKLETGLDPAEYAKAIADVKRAEAKTIEDRVDVNLKRIAALHELKHHTTSVGRFAQSLSNYLGVNTDMPNLWQQKYPKTLNAQGQDVSSTVRVTATNKAPLQNFTLNVTQMASGDHVLSTSIFPDTTTGLGFSGNLVINGKTIAITDGSSGSINMSLSDISNAVSLAFPANDITMQLVSTDGTHYTWELMDSALSIPLDLTGTDQALLMNLGIPLNLQNNALPAITPQANLLLAFTYNGVSMTRAGSNVISDLIPNMTIEVNAANTGLLTCVVDYDRVSVEQAFVEFVKSYNELQKFSRDQTAFEMDEQGFRKPKKDAYLSGNTTLRTELSALNAVLSSWVQGIPTTQANSLASIGIQIGESLLNTNTDDLMVKGTRDLKLDEAMLDQLLFSDKIKQVLAVVGNQVSSSNPYFKVYDIPNFSQNKAAAGVPVTLSVQNVNGTLTGTFSATISGQIVTVPATLLEGGALFQGPSGTPFDGLTVGCTSAQLSALPINGAGISTTITATQGLLAQLQQTIDSYIDAQTGAIDVEIASLEAKNRRDMERADHIKKRAAVEEEAILRQFQYARELESMMRDSVKMMDEYVKWMTHDG